MNGKVALNIQSLILTYKVRLSSIARRGNIDRAVLYGIFSKIWSFAAGPITALIIASKFSPATQGFYYTFGPIMALQSFAELGIGFAIIQFASHEWAHLRTDENRRIEGDPNSLSRLASLFQISFKWYSIGSIIITVGLSIGGYVFFSKSLVQNVNWKLPWISLCVLTGINFVLGTVWSLLEGCNQVTKLYFFRFLQGILGSLVAWSAILIGAGLWTMSIGSIVGLLYAGFFLSKNYWEFFKSLFSIKHQGPRLSWLSDILPFQWKIALSWVSGYFAFSLFTPVLFHYHGPVAAGQMGMTWSLYSALSSLGSAWLAPRVPQFGIMVAQKRYVEMDRLFHRLTYIITGISIVGATTIWLLVFGLNYYGSFLASRLLPPLPTALFLIAAVIYNVEQPMSTYLRAHKKEPLLFISILCGVLVGLSTWLLGKYYSATGMAAGYLTVTIMIFPMVIFVWKDSRKNWHAIKQN